jgi:ferrous iron transport protein B
LQISESSQVLTGEALAQRISALSNEASAAQLEQSWLGRAGKSIEPLFRPLGWDWRVSAAVIAGFPAREVVVAVLGTVYAVGDEAEESRLVGRLRSASWPDGRPVYTLPMVIGLLIFYACCLQCAATLAVIRRETNSWRWPVFAWCYMTTIGYVGALLAFQVGTT